MSVRSNGGECDGELLLVNDTRQVVMRRLYCSGERSKEEPTELGELWPLPVAVQLASTGVASAVALERAAAHAFDRRPMAPRGVP